MTERATVVAGQDIRAATLDDVQEIRAILASHGNDGPVIVADIVGTYVRHLIAHHRALVTRHEHRIVAFGAMVSAGVAVHLADLFVLPERLGEGIGRPLLAALSGGAAKRTTFASDDPRPCRSTSGPAWHRSGPPCTSRGSRR